MSVKKKEVENEIEKWTTPEPGGPQDWEWVERNGARIKPAKGRLCDVVRPPDLPKMSEEEFQELMTWLRGDNR